LSKPLLLTRAMPSDRLLLLAALSGSAGKDPWTCSLADSPLSYPSSSERFLWQEFFQSQNLFYSNATALKLDQQPRSNLDCHTSILIEKKRIMTQLHWQTKKYLERNFTKPMAPTAANLLTKDNTHN
jgi:hypothetical protein